MPSPQVLVLIPYLAKNSEGYKKGDSAFLNEIPAWVGERSEISNLLREDLDNILNQGPTTIEIH